MIWFLAKHKYFKQFGGCKHSDREDGIVNKLRFLKFRINCGNFYGSYVDVGIYFLNKQVWRDEACLLY